MDTETRPSPRQYIVDRQKLYLPVLAGVTIGYDLMTF